MSTPPREPMQSRQARSAATRTALMRAAERLIARRGIGSVTIRDIVSSAGQKNESALQYHFRNLDGLIEAIHQSRGADIEAARSKLLEQVRAEAAEPSLRRICTLMVQPAFDLARSRADFREYVRAFGQEMALTEDSALDLATRKGGHSMQQLAGLLRAALPHLDAAAYRRRMESAVRFCAASMHHQARRRGGFQGPPGELFFHALLDALVGLLSAPESEQTRGIAETIASSRGRRA